MDSLLVIVATFHSALQIPAWPLMLTAGTLENQQAKIETENAFQANKLSE